MVHKECSPVQQKVMIFILTFNFFMFFLLNKVNWEECSVTRQVFSPCRGIYYQLIEQLRKLEI